MSVFGVILSVFSRIQTEYGVIQYGHFLRNERTNDITPASLQSQMLNEYS